jgi:hypothetical protein
MKHLITTLLAMTSLLLVGLSAQDFRGAYVVVATEVTARPVDSIALAPIKLHYGDTVKVVERPNGDEYVIRSEKGKFIIRNASVVPAARFTYKSATEGRGSDATKTKHRHYVVTADSALAFIGSDRIWLMKGAMVLVVGDIDSVTYAAIVYERNARISKTGLLEVVSMSPTAEAELTSPFPKDRTPTTVFRVSGAIGANIPIRDNSIRYPGITYAISGDLPISKSGSYLTIGYSSYGFNVDGSVYAESVDFATLYGGVLIGLNSPSKPVVAYLALTLGIDTEIWEEVYLTAGFGIDFRASKIATLFVEVLPTFTTSPFSVWFMPLRGGVRVNIVD